MKIEPQLKILKVKKVIVLVCFFHSHFSVVRAPKSFSTLSWQDSLGLLKEREKKVGVIVLERLLHYEKDVREKESVSREIS